jgi:hypothetical protein
LSTPEPGNRIIEDQNDAVPTAELAHALEEAGRRLGQRTAASNNTQATRPSCCSSTVRKDSRSL